MCKIELKLESPLMVGGKRLKNNVLQSLDYIPGHVMRAAFVKYILLNCPLHIPGKPDDKGRYNYIAVKDGDNCTKCRFYDACKSFSEIRFSFFYPKDFEILPLTAKACKNKRDEHGIVDILTHTGELKCRKCTENNSQDRIGRMESIRGYTNIGKTISVPRVSFTRTAIDPFTHTALDESLYSVDAVRQGIAFTGEIQGLEKLNVEEGLTLYVGRYTSVGMGRMNIQAFYKQKESRKLLELLEKFNAKMEEKLGQAAVKYIPLLLKSDAKLGFEKMDEFKKPISDEEYKIAWKKKLLGSEKDSLKVEQVYSEYDIYRGYDTSRKWDKWEKVPEIYTLKGTTILLSTEMPLESILPRLEELEKKGVGEDASNGFGEIEICSKLHVEGEV